MSANSNLEGAQGSAANNNGQFHASVPRSEPMMTSGHQPGSIHSKKDAAPEFSAQTLPAGSAPADRTFKPNPNNEAPTTNQDYAGNVDPESERQSASDTLGGATSADVHTGLGHPGQGQSSNELHHGGQRGGSKQGSGMQGVGASGAASGQLADPHDPQHTNLRAVDVDEARIPRGTAQEAGAGNAENRQPETADTVASEAPRS
ncbi:hypothetical protein H2203_000523 [Taxawa tesnikishii (nom. ined.)]|nr:hypothetical protein H2203_000523 [Dothideales sp. JES 119]